MEGKVNFKVNNIIYEADMSDKKIKLLDWLRESAHLTGTKCGCGVGQCGSCFVLIDGKAVRSCLIALEKLEGKKVVTIEGLATADGLHPVQQSFIDCDILQCGFCTPGMIISAVALLNENNNPSREDIAKALKYNYCRCGTYPRVVKAIQHAAAVQRGEKKSNYMSDVGKNDDGEIVGKSIQRADDAKNKVTGKLEFIDDLYRDNSLYGKIVFSEHPYARIKDMQLDEALAVDGVKLILTHKDVPGLNRFGVLDMDQPVLAEDLVRFIGEPVAVVFGETASVAETAAQKVKVDYEVLEGIFTAQRALESDAPLLHEKGNVIKDVNIKRGDIDEAFKNADVMVEGEYYTPWIEHAWIETESSLATPGEDGSIVVYAANQSPFSDRKQLALILALDESKVQVVHLPAGGAFGGKTELTVHAFVALAAQRTKRPAKITLTRKESLRLHPKRHAYFMRYRTAATKDGKLLGMKIDLLADGGAYASWSPRVIEQSVAFSTGPYYIPSLCITGKAVYTNNMVSGAMRGFGANQVHFAAESEIDNVAKALNMNPIELRLINALKPGMAMSTGQLITDGHAYDKTLEIIQKEVNEQLIPLKKERNIGIGVASAWRSVAGGLGPDEDAGATLILKPDGRILLKMACTEMGQGSQTGLAQIVSYILNLPFSSVDIIGGDTKNVPFAGGVMASRGLYLWGHAVMEASSEMKEKIIQEVTRLTGLAEEIIMIKNGEILDSASGKKLFTFKEFASKLGYTIEVERHYQLPKSYPIQEDANSSNLIPPNEFKTHHTNAYNTTAAAVQVDEQTGVITVLKVIIAVDAGRVFNPEAAKKQIEGGIIMGMGAALQEEFVIKDGWNTTDTFKKCKIPSVTDTPREIDIHFVDSLDPTGPMGAKGVGEIGILSIAPAITNAIFDATGKRIFNLPVRL